MSGIKNVVVIGAGFMGSGIGQTSAQNNFKTTIVDIDATALDRCKKYVTSNLKKLKNTPSDHLTFTTNLNKAVLDADLVIEAVVENLRIKQELFRKLEQICPKKTIFATNTSSLLIKNIAKDMKDPSRFGGLHFFYPVPINEIVEVIKGENTSDNTFHRLVEFCREIKKIPIRCKDTPGFIVNSILIPQVNAAIKLVDEGVASIEDIDLACEKALGHPVGPLKLLDILGIDTAKMIWDGIIEHYPEMGMNRSKTLDRLVSQKKFGRKTGEGFYKYKSKI